MSGKFLSTALKRCSLVQQTIRKGGGASSSPFEWGCRPSIPISIRTISSTNVLSDLSSFYRIEVSNKVRPDATRLIVRGPDVDGILASMTVALAQEGCSLKELHAGYCESASDTHSYEMKVEGNQIEDIFFVVEHETGKPFADDSLHDLGQAVLDSLKSPMKCLSGKTQSHNDVKKNFVNADQGSRVTVVRGQD